MFPATDSNLCARSLVEQVLSQYELGAIRDCRLHHRGLNDTYKVESSQDHTYFLRIYRAGWRSREEIAAELNAKFGAAERADVLDDVLARAGR